MLRSILIAVAVILVAIWLVGLVAHVAAGAIHLLLVAAVVLLIANFVLGRSA